jgi:hypothetical protein
MNQVRIGARLIGVLLLMGAIMNTSCAELRPACPLLPVYPQATAIKYEEKEEIIRTTTYQVAAKSGDIISYFKQRLEQSGWVLVNEDSTGFSMDYRTTSNQPPFSIGVGINNEASGIVEYRVALRIGGPFAWRNWCSNLKP